MMGTERKLETSIYLAVAEFHGRRGYGYVKHNEVATFEHGEESKQNHRENLYRQALLSAVSSLVEGEEVVEICVNPEDVEFVKGLVPPEWKELVTSCSYNPAYRVVMEKLLGER